MASALAQNRTKYVVVVRGSWRQTKSIALKNGQNKHKRAALERQLITCSSQASILLRDGISSEWQIYIHSNWKSLPVVTHCAFTTPRIHSSMLLIQLHGFAEWSRLNAKLAKARKFERVSTMVAQPQGHNHIRRVSCNAIVYFGIFIWFLLWCKFRTFLHRGDIKRFWIWHYYMYIVEQRHQHPADGIVAEAIQSVRVVRHAAFAEAEAWECS